MNAATASLTLMRSGAASVGNAAAISISRAVRKATSQSRDFRACLMNLSRSRPSIEIPQPHFVSSRDVNLHFELCRLKTFNVVAIVPSDGGESYQLPTIFTPYIYKLLIY